MAIIPTDIIENGQAFTLNVFMNATIEIISAAKNNVNSTI